MRRVFVLKKNRCHLFVLCSVFTQHTLALQQSTQGESAETVVAIDGV